MRKAILISVCLMLSACLRARVPSPQAPFLPGTVKVCKAHLADGTAYDVYIGVLKASLRGEAVYVDVRAYYMPGSGEFLWWEDILSEHGYRTTTEKERSDSLERVCNPSVHKVQLRDSEWADFWAESGNITIFHSDLKFASIERAWEYVAEHWHDAPREVARSTKWCENINLYTAPAAKQVLGHDFFRPERLRYDARPYLYASLRSVRKVGTNWELEISGADEPNRAIVLLDKHFKLLKVTKLP